MFNTPTLPTEINRNTGPFSPRASPSHVPRPMPRHNRHNRQQTQQHPPCRRDYVTLPPLSFHPRDDKSGCFMNSRSQNAFANLELQHRTLSTVQERLFGSHQRRSKNIRPARDINQLICLKLHSCNACLQIQQGGRAPTRPCNSLHELIESVHPFAVSQCMSHFVTCATCATCAPSAWHFPNFRVVA